MDYIKKYWLVIVLIFVISMFIKPVLCFLIVGLLLLYIGFETIISLKKIYKNGIEWTGHIIEYQTDRDGHKAPLVEFTTIKGDFIKEKPFVYASTDLSKLRTYSKSINHSIPILYDPDNPRRFVLTNDREFNYGVLIILILARLFFIGLSFISLFGFIKIG